MCASQEEVETAFIDYYQMLFTSSLTPNDVDCTYAIKKKVTPNMAQGLLAEFTKEEIHKALHQMAPLKALRPDGYTSDFYQQHWETMGRRYVRLFCVFFNSNHMDVATNATYIALIPKNSSPSNVTEFRPISLCNVLYKIIAKVLANRLKLVLPHVISQNQSAFILGRLITNNILAAYETFHSMHT